MENLIEKMNVSRETITKLKAYEKSLKEWQNKFNLVSNNSLNDAWNRHFLDSLQLMEYIPDDAKTLLDLGSGAGFPAMVIAIASAQRLPDLKVSLVESVKKKTLYLNAVRDLCGVNVNIVNDRIENIDQQKVDVITSRAMCNLTDLLKYAYRFTTKKTTLIFPKGKSYQVELDNAKKYWHFDCKIKQNKICSEGVILLITDLSPLKGVK
ncbi:MAG: 16S rRNA (guanine(527)-N(7))-methyltransferase RsmG [Alphaproteobacteria bacterium]|nr:16S rRNA (guanine(527)-N(7))-methyltransferase RsmG [Alphaproteobacteria bacterium]MBQ8677878.1 16S rRNA (guanine(527)-N(7))-methyltransferase RsmG [Alphaproteobacteria bacterium]